MACEEIFNQILSKGKKPEKLVSVLDLSDSTTFLGCDSVLHLPHLNQIMLFLPSFLLIGS